MARFFGREESSARRARAADAEHRRIEERQRALAQATQQWLAVLREMERNGETGDPTYDTYYLAYLQARQLEKQGDLESFNRQHGLKR